VPTSTPDENDRQRFRFLKAVYDNTQHGDRRQSVDFNVIVSAIGLSSEEADLVADYLVGERLIEWVRFGGGGGIAMTHSGVKAVEQESRAPEKPTQPAPSFNVIQVGHMSYAQIQQGTVSSEQSQTISSGEIESMRDFVAVLREQMRELRLAADAEAELEAQVATIESQMKSAKPKRAILKQVGLTALEILASAPGREAVGEVLKHVPDWLHH
jgi:hypothetical protein